jgi:hypothetical protein
MNLNKETLIVILVVILVGGYFLLNKDSSDSELIACTTEAKQCPDGSYVGRTGPNCEFTECPMTKDEENDSVNLDNSCLVDSDCILVDTSLDHNRCWVGVCGRPDHSKEEYISVNRQNWEKKYPLPTFDVCGPPPLCASIDGDSEAVCLDNICRKVPR